MVYLALVGSAVAAVLGNLGNRLQRLVTPFHYLHIFVRNERKSYPIMQDEKLPQMYKKISSFYTSLFLKPVFRIRIGFRIRIQIFTSRRIRIRVQGAKPMRIHADPDPNPGQTLLSQKVESSFEKYTFVGIMS